MLEPAKPSGDSRRTAADQYTELAVLAGGLAHEIKNPLSTIRLNMELLAEDLAESQDHSSRRALAKVQLVQSQCTRLESLLNDFLRFARLGQLNLQSADLNAEVARALDFYLPQADEANIDVIRYLDPELPAVQLDVETFQAALLNLILNAQQAMPSGGQLVVRTRELPGAVLLDLIDTGCGMEPDVQQHMFEAFYSTKPDGSGLGLPTAKRIVDAHGGRMAMESEVGRGTKVTIVLPTPPRLANCSVETMHSGNQSDVQATQDS
ncbi:MAG TPA: ATP-binding protein [Pirellulales bacterium]|nr:ATP-binding protein [Pirellulales bacterium]